MKTFYVYILASRSGVLHFGMTNDLERRMYEHKHKMVHGFTAKYNCDRLMWYETFSTVGDAIAAEKKIKGWRREKKVDLIVEKNPTWVDLCVTTALETIQLTSEMPQCAGAPFGMTNLDADMKRGNS